MQLCSVVMAEHTTVEVGALDTGGAVGAFVDGWAVGALVDGCDVGALVDDCVEHKSLGGYLLFAQTVVLIQSI